MRPLCYGDRLRDATHRPRGLTPRGSDRTQPRRIARMPDLAPRADLVERLATSLGFAWCGIAPAEPVADPDYFRGWLARGEHGDMAFLAEQVEERLDPAALVPGAKAIICVADAYGDRGSGVGYRVSEEETATASPTPPAHGRIAGYAQQPDYHRTMKKRLHALADELRIKWPQHTFRSCVDTAPVMERQHATRAGLGFIGKHTLLIHPRAGSWLLLGEIITTLPLQWTTASGGGSGGESFRGCGACTRCIDACPTRCIDPAGYRLDATRCISYLTIEHKGVIDASLHAAMGDWLAGCDVCQAVCPFNQGEEGIGDRGSGRVSFAPSTPLPTPHTPHPSSLPLLDVLQWTPAQRQAALVNSALKRIKLDQFKRNALIAAGNRLRSHDDAALRQRIVALAEDRNESDLVRHTANQVLTGVGR